MHKVGNYPDLLPEIQNIFVRLKFNKQMTLI